MKNKQKKNFSRYANGGIVNPPPLGFSWSLLDSIAHSMNAAKNNTSVTNTKRTPSLTPSLLNVEVATNAADNTAHVNANPTPISKIPNYDPATESHGGVKQEYWNKKFAGQELSKNQNATIQASTPEQIYRSKLKQEMLKEANAPTVKNFVLDMMMSPMAILTNLFNLNNPVSPEPINRWKEQNIEDRINNTPFLQRRAVNEVFGTGAEYLEAEILGGLLGELAPYAFSYLENVGQGIRHAAKNAIKNFNKKPAVNAGINVGQKLNLADMTKAISIPFETHVRRSAITKANRMLAQEDKILKYNTPETLQKFKDAANGERFEILSYGEYANKYNRLPTSPGYNWKERQAGVIKDWFKNLSQITVPKTIENIAAHEVDHFYAPMLEEAEELHKIFDVSIFKKKAMEMEALANVETRSTWREGYKRKAKWYGERVFPYFNGNPIKKNYKKLYIDNDGNRVYMNREQYYKYNNSNPSNEFKQFNKFRDGVELRARVGQLKELIGKHNGYDLSKNFPVTKEDLDWVLENYFEAGGENNNMDMFFELLADKELLLKYMNKYALSIIPAAGIMYGVSKDEETEKEVKQ
jgi:hypothetical protein